MLQPPVLLLLVADAGPYRLLIPTDRVDEISSGPEVLPDEVALPFPENTTRDALAVLEPDGINVPLARGCAEPLAMPNAGTAELHGSTGLDGVTLPEPGRQPIDTYAVDFIIEMASHHRGELVLATIGPETNVALALRREPRLKHWLAEIAVMGESSSVANRFSNSIAVLGKSRQRSSGVRCVMAQLLVQAHVTHDFGGAKGIGMPVTRVVKTAQAASGSQ